MIHSVLPSKETEGAVKSVMEAIRAAAKAAMAAGERGIVSIKGANELRCSQARTVISTSIRMPVPAFIIYAALEPRRWSSRFSSAWERELARRSPFVARRRGPVLEARAKERNVFFSSSHTSTRGARHKSAVKARLVKLPRAERPKWYSGKAALATPAMAEALARSIVKSDCI